MQIARIPFEDIPQLSDFDKAYASGDERLSPFIAFPSDEQGLRRSAEMRLRTAADRELLTAVIEKQYKRRGQWSDRIREKVSILEDERTVTVTTAHQPCLFTGPLYFIYKIISVISLAEKLDELWPDINVLPVFVAGSEDHDIEEINHLMIGDERFQWITTQRGPVGRMKNEGIGEVINRLRSILQGTFADELLSILESAFRPELRYSDSMLHLIADLFESYGLIVLSMDEPELKRAFLPVMEEELLRQTSRPLVVSTQERLAETGFREQAFARDINLFYLEEDSRERIVIDDGIYRVLDTDKSWDESSLLSELHEHPDRFSPNVVLRPLYQESILPNIAYIGGGGELAYWIERKKQFEHFGVHYPVLLRRDSALWLDAKSRSLRQKIGLRYEDIFRRPEEIKEMIIREVDEDHLELDEQIETLESLYEEMAEKAAFFDQSLRPWVLAQGKKRKKEARHIEKRIVRAAKKRHEIEMRRVEKLRPRLFPSGSLQERHESFLPFYATMGPAYFDTLKEAFDPLQTGFVILEED